MGILDEDIARVRSATDLVAVISQYTQLRKVGRRLTGLCPFHTERSPSFSVNAEEGLYYCFGCGARGDVITFVREKEQLDFVGAVEWLAGRAGVTLRYTDSGEDVVRKKKARLAELAERAVEWYHDRLLSAPDAAAARGYLRSRGFDGDEVRRYRLGWAPEGWDSLARALSVPNEVWVESGLGTISRRGTPIDWFRGRLLFPIFDAQGGAIGFGGRILPGGEGPKYLNTRDTPLYDKSRVLYGLHWAKEQVVRADEVIVCEGYTDVIGFARAGVPRAVATCGTALTEEHVRELKKYARRVVLAFDADAAGQSAAERFYAWEQKYDVDVAVAALPGGVDPADLALSDPVALEAAVAGARPFLEFRIERVMRSAKLGTPEGRARAAEQCLVLIREHPNELVRDQYLRLVESRTGVDAAQLRERLRGRGRALPVDRGPRPGPRRDTPEFQALRLAIQRPEEVADWLEEVLFHDELARLAFRSLLDAPTLHEAIETAEPAVSELLQRLAVEDTDAEAFDVVVLLLAAAGQRALGEIQAEARMAEEPTTYGALIAWLKLLIEELWRPEAAREAAEQLLPWLVNRSEQGGG